MSNPATFWNGVADGYAKSPIGDPDAYNYTLERTRSYLGGDDHVLELGCGTASTAVLLAPDTGRYHATDVSDAMIGIGRSRVSDAKVKNLSLTVSDVAEATRNQQYDAVLAFNLLHLLPDLEADLGRIAQAMKPGGLFISKTVCKPTGLGPLKFRAMMMIALPVMQLVGKAPFVAIRRIEEFEQMITGSGFQIIETGNHPANPPSRYIVARKL